MLYILCRCPLVICTGRLSGVLYIGKLGDIRYGVLDILDTVTPVSWLVAL
jgi:hypothetical protein